MSESAKPAILVRAGAQRIELYNEGLCVYLYDAANRDTLLAADAWELTNLALETPPPKDPRLEPFAQTGMLVAYELQQDDPICVDVLVGDPPSPKELKLAKGLKWKKPQVSRVKLPTGILWIDTPNSCRINKEEEPQEPGGEVRVPPGDYVVTLHRVDWEETDDTVSDGYAGPHEVITLTPAAGAKPNKNIPWALLWPVLGPDMSWVGNYSIAGNVFTGQANFWDYWEFFWINLDPAAYAQLNLGIGSVLELKIAKPPFRCVIVILGDKIEMTIGHLGLFQLLFSHDALTAPLSAEPEVAYARFKAKKPDSPPEPDVLLCIRAKATAAVDKKLHEKWKPMTLTVLPTRLPLPAPAMFRQWTRELTGVRGTVLLRSPRYLSISFDSAALQAINAAPGDTLTLHIGDEQRHVRLFADAKAWAAAQNELTGGFGNSNPEWDKLHMALMRADGDAAEEAARAKMRTFLLGDVPLAAHLDHHWLEKDQPILLIQPMPADKPMSKLDFTIDVQTPVASSVLLSKP